MKSFEDLKRFKYIKRLLNRYRDTGQLSERLILNHVIVIFNVFGNEAGLDILELRIDLEYWNVIKPFLIFLNVIDNTMYTNIEMDKVTVEALRKIRENFEMGLLKSATDLVFTIRFLKLLVTPFEKLGAYKAGIIDKDGKKNKDFSLNNIDDREAYRTHYTPFIRLVINLKRLMAKRSAVSQ